MGRRHHRLRRTLGALALLAVVALVVGVWAYLRGRTQVRRPGEALDEITEKLSRNLPAEAPMPRLEDVTAAAGLASFRAFTGERSSQLPEDMGAGLAWGDFDNDGDDDLFVVGAGAALTAPADRRAPSELFENLGDGTFAPVADFPATRIQGMAAAWGDYDGDGWLDLVVTGYGDLLLFHNDRGRLTPDDALSDALDGPGGYWAGAVWGDFDGDRDLDLYVCGYVRYVEDSGQSRQVSRQYGAAVPYTLNPASFEPAANLLFENRSDGTFAEVAALWGVSNPEGRSLSALWHDFDQDGRLDLYVANDISDNALFLNRGDSFQDAGLTAWVADYRGAMGLAAGDFDRDGDDDLFVTHWLAQENALYDSRLVEFAAARAAGGTAPALAFADVGAPLGVGQIALQMVGWGTEFADLDGDGWLDLLVANGSTRETGEPKRLEPQPAMLLWSQRGEYFHDLAPLDAALAEPRVSRGLAVADPDGDGDLDVALYRLDGGLTLLANEMQTGNWLALRLRSRGRTPDGPLGFAEGSTATARVGGVGLRRTVGGASYLSQSGHTLHFGLGDATVVDEVEVRWLGGETQSFGPLEANTLWELIEGDREPRRRSGRAKAEPLDERARVVAFWKEQRAGMDAMKIDGDIPRAVEHFRAALSLDPAHQDSRYYLANCLATLGDTDGALAELQRLLEEDPGSHRGQKQWGVLRALTARSDEHLAAAQAALERAVEINREETGSLLALAEVELLRGDRATARQRLEWATSTNPRAVGGFFLLGYLAWSEGRRAESVEYLANAHAARGPEWKPEGSVAEGDVAVRMHHEMSPLSRFWERWEGDASDPDRIFAELAARLAG